MAAVRMRDELPAGLQAGTGSAGGDRLIAVVCALACIAYFAPATLKAEAVPMAAPSIEVAVEQGRLTVDVRDAPLEEVLQAVGDEAGIAIELHGDLTAPVTDSFADLTLDEGIRRLLGGHSYTLSSSDAVRIGRIEISVLSSHRLESAPSAANASTPDAEQGKLQRIRTLLDRKDAEAIAELSRLAGGDPSPAVRAQATAALARLRSPEASAPLALALTDPSSAVRVQAMRGVKSFKGAGAIGDLQAIAGYDPDAAVRRQAVRLMSDIDDPEVPWLLKQAAADNDPVVSQEAKRAARRWEQRYGTRYGVAGGSR